MTSVSGAGAVLLAVLIMRALVASAAAVRQWPLSTGQPKRPQPWAMRLWLLAACWLGAAGAGPASAAGRGSRQQAGSKQASRQEQQSHCSSRAGGGGGQASGRWRSSTCQQRDPANARTGLPLPLFCSTG